MKRKVLWLVSVLLFVSTLGCVVVETGSLEPSVAEEPVQVAPTPTSGPAEVIPPSAVISDLETQVSEVYQATGDSVVNIVVTVMGTDFFMNPTPQEGSGSGFVYDEEGHIVTNAHVVADADEILVTFADGRTVPATVVGIDQPNDLAVIRVNPERHPVVALPLADSDDLRVGQFVVAIGNPFGLEQTVTFGVISSLGRIIESPEYNRFIGEAIQTDAAINPGNSGGPLLDLAGRVIGVNAQIVSPSRANAGIGFAIPVNTVKRVVPELISQGYYRHPYMGVTLLPLPQIADILQEAGIEVPDEGVMVETVIQGSPADEAGLQGATETVNLGRLGSVPIGGDIIVALNGEDIMGWQDFNAYLETSTRVGETVEVTILRDGQRLTLSLTLGERPENLP
jgi:S1-C subfamily serine protease